MLIEDFLFDLMRRRSVAMTFEDVDRIMERCLDVARVRYVV
jgi:hypothetical protein